MASHRNNAMARRRDFGLSGQNGKGSAPRHTVNANWTKRFDNINMGPWDMSGFTVLGPGRIRKVY